MNSKEVHGSLRQFPTDQLQGHRIKKVELKLLAGAFFATDKIPHRPTLLIHQQPLSYCSSNGSELVRLSGPWSRSSSWLRVPEIGAVQATFESSTQHLVANCGGMFEIIQLATGFSYLQNRHFSPIVSIIMSAGSFIYVGAGFPASVCL